jgi:hypothetical protein
MDTAITQVRVALAKAKSEIETAQDTILESLLDHAHIVRNLQIAWEIINDALTALPDDEGEG